jgi:hypothetical protein
VHLPSPRVHVGALRSALGALSIEPGALTGVLYNERIAVVGGLLLHRRSFKQKHLRQDDTLAGVT